MSVNPEEVGNPLATDDPLAWERAFVALSPVTLVAVAQRWMGPALRHWTSPEDLVQDAWLHVVRSRDTLEWRGPGPFRAYFLTILRRRIHDEADRLDRSPLPLGSRPGPGTDSSPADPWERLAWVSSTASRAASAREESTRMVTALESLTPELRDVVELRLFEGLTSAETAERLGLGLSAVKHRFVRGAALYRAALGRGRSAAGAP